MNEWQPIETAPKDGTDIIAFTPEEHHKIDIITWDRVWWIRARCSDGLEVWGKPTHWMPLPSVPPQPLDQGGKSDKGGDHPGNKK